MMNESSSRLALAFGLATMLAAGPALAQTEAPQDPQDRLTVQEIIVTARKRVENLRDVPVSIQTVSGDELVESSITQIRDVVARLPSLTLSYGVHSPYAQIRGLGTGNNSSFDQAVGKFVDNVSYGRDQDLRLPLFDLERVEMLKGPQVLLYGNSTTAGALNITTRRPGREFAADASVAYEFDAREVIAQGGVTLPLGEVASLRVSGLYQDLDRGFVRNSATGRRDARQKNYAGRAILVVDPTEDLKMFFKVEYDRLRSYGQASEVYVPTPFRGIVPPFFTDVDIDNVTDTNNDVAPFFQPAFQGLNNTTYQADINYDMLGGTLTSTTAYRDVTTSGSAAGYHPVPIANAFQSNEYDQFSQELRFSGKYDRLDITVGAFFQSEDILQIQAIDFNPPVLGVPAPPFAANFILDQKTKSYSVFADATYAITPSFSIELGARWTKVRRNADQSATPGAVVPNKGFGLAPVAANPGLDPVFAGFFGTLPHVFTGMKFRDSFIQPQVVLQYRFTDTDQAYFRFVKGSKAGGFDANYPGAPTGNFPADDRFESETARSFELGMKGLAFDRRVEYSVAAFYTKFSDLQANAFVAANTVSRVTNVGSARTRGVEGEFTWRLADAWGLSGSVTYADAKYLDYPGAACTIDQALAAGPACLQDLSGKATPFSSKWSWTLGLDYRQPIGDYTLSGGVLLVGRSSYNPSSNNEPNLVQDGYAQLDANIDIGPSDGPWTISLYGRNLTDKQYLEYGENTPVTLGALAIFRSRGRQIGLRGSLNF